jgi:SAM-dependent methyltransferase
VTKINGKYTQAERADRIAKQVDNTAQQSLDSWFEFAWARTIPLPLPMPEGTHLNLGAGNRHIGDAIPLDFEHGWNADLEPIPYDDGSVAGIHANGFFEHVQDPIAVLWECQRVLQPGGVLNIVVPHGLSDLWAEDVTHVKRLTEETWSNIFDNPYYDTTAGHGSGPGKSLPWQMGVRTCFIMGVVWRNLALFTQIQKEINDEEGDF